MVARFLVKFTNFMGLHIVQIPIAQRDLASATTILLIASQGSDEMLTIFTGKS